MTNTKSFGKLESLEENLNWVKASWREGAMNSEGALFNEVLQRQRRTSETCSRKGGKLVSTTPL